MAAPRCMRSFMGPAKRVKITHAPQPYTQTFSRMKSSRAEEDNEKESRDEKDTKLMEQLKLDLESGDMPLDQRLEDMGIDPKEFRTLYASQQKVNRRQAESEPKTREEAARQWKELQNTPDNLGMLKIYKKAGLEPIKIAQERDLALPTDKPPLDPQTAQALEALRTPINVRAVHLQPLRRAPTHGVPTCDLQLRTYSVRNVELFADFAVRAAYYMGLCARGPIPLPRITERWTVPRSNFIFKKSQENFERVTLRRLVQIQDGHPDVVKAWLAFLQKYQMHGVGMKANIWEYEDLDGAVRAGENVKEGDYSRRREGAVMRKVEEILGRSGFKGGMGGSKGGVEMRP